VDGGESFGIEIRIPLIEPTIDQSLARLESLHANRQVIEHAIG